MKHQRVRELLAGAGLCAFLASCTSEQATIDVREKEREAQSATSERTLDGDHPGQTAVVLRWLKPADTTRAKELRIVVENTTDEPQDVELLLSGTPPSRQEVIEQKWTDIVLGAKETRTLSLPIGSIPVQSTVHSAGLRVVASFTEAASAGTAARNLAFSESRTLTSASDFKSVHVRTPDEQSRVHTLAANVDALLQSSGEVRQRNQKSGAFALANAIDARTGLRHGVMIVRDVSPAEVEGTENAMHYPDTDAVPRDAGAKESREEL